jgi:hypothetical protein
MGVEVDLERREPAGGAGRGAEEESAEGGLAEVDEREAEESG